MKTVSALRALILAAAVVLPAALPASAEDAMRKIGDGNYALRITGLDLSQPAGRQAALRDLNTAAHKICFSQQTPNVLRRACQKQIVSSTIANAKPAVQKALQLAMTERPEVQLAAR